MADLIATWLTYTKDGVDAFKGALEAISLVRSISSNGKDNEVKKINDALDAALTKLIEARSEHLKVLEIARSLNSQNSELSEQLRRKNNFEERATKYKLVPLPFGGVAYTRIDGPHSEIHYCCANCFEREQISYLQPTKVRNSSVAMRCSTCQTVVTVIYSEGE